MINAVAITCWVHAAKDDVSSQASGGELPPAPPAALSSPFQEHPRLAGNSRCRAAGHCSGGLVPHGSPMGTLSPIRGVTDTVVGREDRHYTMCKPPASYQRRLEGRSGGKKMIKTIYFF